MNFRAGYLCIIGLLFMVVSVSATVWVDSNVPKVQINVPEVDFLTTDNIWTGSNTFTNITAINYTNINHVNNSEYLQGLTPQQVADLRVLDLNTTQFETGEPVTIKSTWLESFVNTLSKWENYLTLDQSTPQTIIGGVPFLDEDRIIDQENHIVDKSYVDNKVASLGQRFFMYDDNDITTDYKLTNVIASDDIEKTFTKTGLINNDYVIGWISPVGQAPTTLLAGVYEWKMFAQRTDGTRDLRLFWELVERYENGTEVVIATSPNGNLVTSKSFYNINIVLSGDYELQENSRVVGKIYAFVGASGSAPEVTLYYEGDSDSRWNIPINVEVLNTLYYSKTENINATGYNITADNLNGTNTGDQDLSGYAQLNNESQTIISKAYMFNSTWGIMKNGTDDIIIGFIGDLI